MNIRDLDARKGVNLTKTRIKHCEAHGLGSCTMQEKEILKKQLRNIELKFQQNGRKI